MDKNSLQEYGWIVIIVIIIAILIAFATPFGKFIVTSVQNIVDGISQINQDIIINLNKLKPPKNLFITNEETNYILTYDPVKEADGYIIFIDGDEKIVTTETSVDITEHLEGLTGAVTVEVVATDSTQEYGNSPKAKCIHRMPGLYKTGTYKLIKAWEVLVSENVINVTDGVVASSIDLNNGSNNSAEILAGDLIIAPGTTGIGDYAFAACSNLTEVWMPNTITSMGAAAFGLCESLEKITLSDRLTSIPEMAFMQANALKTINIPNNVTAIGEAAFYFAKSLESIYIGSNVSSIGGMIVSGCDNLATILVSPDNSTYHSYKYGNCIIETASKTLIVGCKGTVIPADGSVTIIGAQAFMECVGLEKIVIPDSVTVIEESAFGWCENLKVATMSNNIKSIGDSAFRQCRKLEKIYLPEGLESIGEFCFSFCTGMRNVNIPSTLSVISDYAFQECHSFTEIVIPEGVTTIGEYAYGMCIGAKRMSISSSTTDIHKEAFFALTSLETISVSDENTVYHDQNECLIKTAAKSLIYGCKNSVIPDDGSVTHIENYAFQECSGLKHMYIPKEITRIEVEAFKRCGYLESIVVEEGNPAYFSVDNCLIQKGGSKLRYGCKNSIIPSDGSVLTIENQAFNGCVGLKHVYIPAVIQDVDTHAFFDCVNVETITVEEGNARYHSDGNCLIETATKQVRLACKNSIIPTDGSVTSVFGVAFADAVPMTALVIPDSITSLNYNNFDDLIYLEKVYLPGTLAELKTYCFDGCINLKDIYFDGYIDQWNTITKDSYWIDSTQAYTVHCIDGDIVAAQ